MHTYLLIGTNREERDKQIADILKKYSISHFDQTIISQEQSIGIEKIRQIQKTLSVSTAASQNRAIIIYNFETATLDAQNALLKTLEEPPRNTFLILSGTSEEKIIPTILSRAFIIRSAKTSDAVNTSPENQTLEILRVLKEDSASARIIHAQIIGKDKESIKTFLKDSIFGLRHMMLDSYKASSVPFTPLYLATLLRKFDQAHDFVKRNINAKLTLEVLFLSLPRPQ